MKFYFSREIVNKILKQSCFEEKPPVIVDVGASGKLRKVWRVIAPFSIYLAFDADTRDLSIVEGSKDVFKQSFIINRIVSDTNSVKTFYFTQNPHCSSTLKPDLEKLKNYHLKDFFEVENIVNLPAVSLAFILKHLKISYVDWFKTDSQGTDLRIFKSMGDEYIKRVLIAEFEPGILDAYEGEDKLYEIMAFFEDKKGFWCDECLVKGLSRIPKDFYKRLSRIEKRFINCFQKPAAFWAEISYMNEMEGSNWTRRDYLLMVIFAILKGQYGFALEIMEKGKKYLSDDIFEDIKQNILKVMRFNGYRNLPFYILRRIEEMFF